MSNTATDKVWSYKALSMNFSFNTLNYIALQMNNNGLNFANVSNPLLPNISNATTIAVIAVLYDALKKEKDIGFIGYSHGTQIVFNGILAFAFQGEEQRKFLRNRVRVFYTGRMVDEHSVTLLTRLVNDFDQLANPGDEVSMSLGNIPPTVDFLKGLSQTQIQIGLEDTSVQNALVDFLTAKSSEQHKFYLYAQKIKAGNRRQPSSRICSEPTMLKRPAQFTPVEQSSTMETGGQTHSSQLFTVRALGKKSLPKTNVRRSCHRSGRSASGLDCRASDSDADRPA